MKNELKKLIAILLFGAVALGGCAVENRGHRGRNNDRGHHNHNDRDNNYNNDRGHHYNNY